MRKICNSFVIVFFLMASLPVFSQPGHGPGPGPGPGFGQGRRADVRMEAIESRRIAHITNALSLNPAEARLFWPVYNEYLAKAEQLNAENRAWQQRVNQIQSMSEKEAAEIAEREVRRMEEAAALKRQYHEKLKDILSARKIAQLYEAERSFNRMLFRQTQERQGR